MASRSQPPSNSSRENDRSGQKGPAPSVVKATKPKARALCGKLPHMNTANQPNVKFVQTPDYRDAYSNSVQIRVNVWDFFLVFGTMQQSSETQVELHNFQGIYLSPQQAKALMALLQQNVSNYEAAFGEIKLDPRSPGGPVH
jgi:hypothetical protein